ncbi:transcriptional repressor [Acetanaerobacterium sp. MSJ-12]|uniref:Fur family transcriptional regulator, peroxide stress response regulator n=1 Tax=Bittarella massiliensis (ex Durand et al. 2017) TaxID=1720313 RepID=A0AAQ1RWA6_9FIRM|nr:MULTISPECIES: transcriptional repressor [Oscillospiraceae]MCB5941585.1 transcriptional repressor [bacterium 210820-DFI.6.52]MBC2871875.1 transcriptional repressor [Bittarella massiliensis (ex Durand et al. 2017)]MBU5420267.1 transcriptional repressor [Acetanaerobacterium sp. MSJ-12]MZL70296.1 transcriptional repressor [Bittarella massiliensis (ex Durand et al. 2017)]MZL80938.1 transcriptional repressor [Bittarella massiliensis (ex Durand et al. 2017)]
MKYSRQRELVLAEVKSSREHPTADMVYAALKADNPSLSLGTVYRNLNLLAQMGQIHKIGMPEGSDRFDGRTDEHYHMLCQKCGRVYDVQLDTLSELDGQIQSQTGFLVHSHDLIVRGVCRACQQ